MKPSGAVFDRTWRQSCTLSRVSRVDVDAMIRRHYIGKWPGVCMLILALCAHGQPLGVIVFALPPRETAVRYGGTTWELARLWIDDSVPSNAETFVIGKSLRYIKRHHPNVLAVVSYSDPSAGHQGTIYRAANFLSDGRTDQERKTPRFDYVDARNGKRYSRRSHVPDDAVLTRIARVSKARWIYYLRTQAATR